MGVKRVNAMRFQDTVQLLARSSSSTSSSCGCSSSISSNSNSSRMCE